MNKKIVVILIICLLIFGGVCYFDVFNQNGLKVGVTTFNMPKGYHESGVNDAGELKITNNDNNTIFLSEYSDDNIDQYVYSYRKYNGEKNNTVFLKNFTVDNVFVYKSDLINDTNNVHYWFVYNNHTYMVYSWDGNVKMDSIVFDLIKSAKSSN